MAIILRKMFLFSFILILLSYSCGNLHSEKINSDSKCVIQGIRDFYRCKKEFGISEIKDMGPSGTSRLFLYTNSCRFSYQKDSIIKIENYVIFFPDSSNTQIEIITFSSVDYTNQVVKELTPYVNAVRNFKDPMENRKFCLPYYLSRVYNFAVKNNKLYLFGFDAVNATSENITSARLKNLDAICNALK